MARKSLLRKIPPGFFTICRLAFDCIICLSLLDQQIHIYIYIYQGNIALSLHRQQHKLHFAACIDIPEPRVGWAHWVKLEILRSIVILLSKLRFKLQGRISVSLHKQHKLHFAACTDIPTIQPSNLKFVCSRDVAKQSGGSSRSKSAGSVDGCQ